MNISMEVVVVMLRFNIDKSMKSNELLSSVIDKEEERDCETEDRALEREQCTLYCREECR